MSHIERMKEEHKELTAKISGLNMFIHSSETFKTLCDLEQARMIKQCGFMESYANVLDTRIWVSVST